STIRRLRSAIVSSRTFNRSARSGSSAIRLARSSCAFLAALDALRRSVKLGVLIEGFGFRHCAVDQRHLFRFDRLSATMCDRHAGPTSGSRALSYLIGTATTPARLGAARYSSSDGGSCRGLSSDRNSSGVDSVDGGTG